MWPPCGGDYPAFSRRRVKRIDKDEEEAGTRERQTGEEERKRGEETREKRERERVRGELGWKTRRRKAIEAERLLNLRRLCVVNEPDMLYAFARVRENYETQNKVPAEGIGEARNALHRDEKPRGHRAFSDRETERSVLYFRRLDRPLMEGCVTV